MALCAQPEIVLNIAPDKDTALFMAPNRQEADAGAAASLMFSPPGNIVLLEFDLSPARDLITESVLTLRSTVNRSGPWELEVYAMVYTENNYSWFEGESDAIIPNNTNHPAGATGAACYNYRNADGSHSWENTSETELDNAGDEGLWGTVIGSASGTDTDAGEEVLFTLDTSVLEEFRSEYGRIVLGVRTMDGTEIDGNAFFASKENPNSAWHPKLKLNVEAEPVTMEAGVVAYYTFNGNSLDSTAYMHDGETHNLSYSDIVPPALEGAKSLFWGDHSVRRYVQLPVIRGLGSDFSITFWARLPENYSNPGGGTPILSSAIPQAPGFNFFLNNWNTDNRNLLFSTTNNDLEQGNVSTPDNVFKDGVWQHVALVRSGQKVSFYIDGSPVGTNLNVLADFPVDQALRIGQNYQSGTNVQWSGHMADFAIWDVALNETRISRLVEGSISPADYMRTPPRAIVYYPFDSSSEDVSGLGYDADDVNIDYSADVPAAINYGESAHWQDHAVQRYFDIPALKEMGTDFSVTLWAILPDAYSNPGGGTTILANAPPQTPGFHFFVNTWNSDNRKLIFSTTNDKLETITASTSEHVLSDGEWHHIALIRHGNTVSFYVDGSPVGTNLNVLADFPVDQALRIGQNYQSGTNYQWSGHMDDFAIWNGALSPNMIKALAEGTDSPSNHTPPEWWAEHYISEMDGFYRYQTMTQNWLKQGGGIISIPDYLTTAGNFPYIKRDYSMEGIFVDEFMLVRPLGGWSVDTTGGEANEPHDHIREFDIAYKSNGTWQYRWDKLFDRIDPYIDYGYSRLTFVTDNTCWDFPSSPSDLAYGQASPPEDMNEWKTFIEAMSDNLADRYGAETVDQWQFRVGTETAWNARFNGTEEQHNSFYDHTVAAIESRFPNAQIGPSNYVVINDTSVYQRGWTDFIEHCASGINHVSGSVGTRYDFTSKSVYLTWYRDRDPESTISAFRDDIAVVENILGYSPPAEIHEYGILYNEHADRTTEQGAWGAAWHFHTLMGMYSSGISKIQHWALLENVGGGNRLLSGQGWVYMVLDHLRGGKLFELQHPQKSESGTQYRAYAVDKGNTRYIVMSALNLDRNNADSRPVTIRVPRDMMPVTETSRIRHTSLTRENSLYDKIREDLKNAGLLMSPWSDNEGTISEVIQMGGTDGRTYVGNNWNNHGYEQLFESSLTLEDYQETLTRNGSYNEFTIVAENPSIHIIAIETPFEAIEAYPSRITADGADSSTIKVTIRDGAGSAMPNKSVFFEIAGGNPGDGGLSGGPWTTDSRGEATTKLTTTEPDTFTVTGYIGPDSHGRDIGTVTIAAFSPGDLPRFQWYEKHGLLPDNEEDWKTLDDQDPHKKGMTLRQEYIADTDPNDQGSLFVITNMEIDPHVRLHFNPVSENRVYSLQYMKSLGTDDWKDVSGQQRIHGINAGGSLEDTDPTNELRFYGIKVEVP